MTPLHLVELSVLPNLVTVLLLLVLPTKWVRQSVAIAVAFAGLAGTGAVALLVNQFSSTVPIERSLPWLMWDSNTINLGCYVDRLAGMMLASVCVISFLIQLYSVWYMRDDPERKRFFGIMAFFTWAMTCFVVSGSLLTSYIFWELIGFASYLLIGFWHHKPAARRAAIKAFVMTRFGDLGFLAAVVVLLMKVRNLDISFLIGRAPAMLDPASVFLVLVLLFLGVMGKSAQFPLHSWLPDAMEGPTPVSALIHSATMVAAGVYLLVRLYPLLVLSDAGMTLILVVGAITSVMAAVLALTERDMKRILAYSTVSQLGFMVMAIGAGAYSGAMFHLLTHAVFKSMLFLLAGYFISVAHHSNDIFDMAKIARANKSPLMIGLLWIGGLSLAGVFPFAGFMSKESIFSTLLATHQYGVYGVALGIAFLTAYYTVRMACVVSRNGSQAEHDSHPVASGFQLAMKLPVTLLGVVTVVGVWVTMPWLKEFFHLHDGMDHEFWVNTEWTVSAVLLGMATAWGYFGRSTVSDAGWVPLVPGLAWLIKWKFFVDAFWDWVLYQVVYGFAHAGAWCERVLINAAVDRVGNSLLGAGRRTSILHGGQVQKYLLVTVLGVVGVILYLACP